MELVSASTGTGGSGGDPLLDVAFALDGARWEIPCQTHTSAVACDAGAMTANRTIGGVPGTTYTVTLWVCGVVEQNIYTGGTAYGYFRVGGNPDSAGWNVYRLDVSAPQQSYYFNNGSSGILYCHLIDYQADIVVEGGAALTLVADALDGQQVQNIDSGDVPIVVSGIPPAPAAYDGQFIQTDVLNVVQN